MQHRILSGEHGEGEAGEAGEGEADGEQSGEIGPKIGSGEGEKAVQTDEWGVYMVPNGNW